MIAIPEELKSPAVVELVNRCYHEIESETYDQNHPEIFEREGERWRRLLKRGPTSRTLRVLDVGTGTGFATLQVLSIHPDASVLCIDLSAAMLARAEKKIGAAFPCAKVRFLETSPDALEESECPFDLICMNSVLHHLPNPASTLHKLAKLLTTDGAIIVSHEPNAQYYSSPECIKWTTRAVSWRYRASIYLDPRRYVRKLLSIIGVLPPRPPERGIATRVVEKLEAEGKFERGVLRPEWISALVDFHIPRRSGLTAGGSGFDLKNSELLRGAGLMLDHFEDYDHLADESHAAPIHTLINKYLAVRFAGCGAHFAAILRRAG